jgi:uncharacterized protein YceH (UPF0502 family)
MDGTMTAETPGPLGPAEVRVLGSLVEKDITTHDYYPLTLNALTNACNQSTNRDPVVSYSEQEVTRALDLLRERRLAFVFQGAESRVPKFGHRLVESLELDRPGIAVLCVLMLRGPQTAGEVRSRTGRMHEFESLAEVEAALESLCSRPAGSLAARLPRQRGMKEQRYAHLLGGPADLAGPGEQAAAEPAAARPGDERVARLEGEVEGLHREVAELRRELSVLKGRLG